MSAIKVNPIVKNKLDFFKKESGSLTYSDAINLLLSEYYHLKREKIKKELRENKSEF